MRSSVFALWLQTQSPKRKAEIRLAERDYLLSVRERNQVAERDFQELMAGILDDNESRYTSGPFNLTVQLYERVVCSESSTNWSWKPARDKALGDRMVTYTPARHPLAGIRF